MLKINEDDHPIMRQFHKLEDEKRMVVILDDSLYCDWLSTSVSERREYLLQYPSNGLICEARPRQ